jgi:hypothetical protein
MKVLMRSAIAFGVLASAAVAVATVAPAQTAPKLFFEGDIVRSAQQGAPGPFCVLNSQFKRKERVAWRIRVLDHDGQTVDDTQLKSLFVVLPDGQKFQAFFRGHPPQPPQTDNFWSVSWIIPENYPTGSFGYKVIATDAQGREQTWEPFKVAASQLTVIPGDLQINR